MFAESAYKQSYSRKVTEEMKWRRVDAGDQQSKEEKIRGQHGRRGDERDLGSCW